MDLLEVKGNNIKEKEKEKDREKEKDKDGDEGGIGGGTGIDTAQLPPPPLSTSSSSSSFASSFPSFQQKSAPSPLDSTNQSSSSSSHGLNGIHGIASGGPGNEESYAVRLASLMSVPTCITERGADSRCFFALNEKIIAAESCNFAVSVRAHTYLHIHVYAHTHIHTYIHTYIHTCQLFIVFDSLILDLLCSTPTLIFTFTLTLCCIPY